LLFSVCLEAAKRQQAPLHWKAKEKKKATPKKKGGGATTTTITTKKL
jgi:hypothetical protein